MMAMRDAVTLSHYKADIQIALVGPQGDSSTPAKCRREEGRVGNAMRKDDAR